MIPLLDLKRQYASIEPELEAAALAVLQSGEYVLGRRVAHFEEEFAAYCGVKEAVALNTGTSALHLALLAAGVGPGDEVITVPMTFVATVAAIRYTGAKAVFVDVDPATWTMDPGKLRAAVTSRTRVVLPVHLHGRLADMASINAIARRHRLTVIEDAAQAHGAERHGRRAGAFGQSGCFSFYPGKNLGACGEGGALVTDDAGVARTARLLRDWGQDGKYNHVCHGFNYRMDALQAALLSVKLKQLPAWTDGRRRVAARYDRALKGSAVARPTACDGLDHAWHVYAVQTDRRDHVQAELAQAGVATGIHYPRPVHLQPAYADLGYGQGDFPVSEALADRLLSLPIYPELTDAQIDGIASSLQRICGAFHAEPLV